MSARAIIVAAPRSGSGKTTVTLGLLRALARRGLRVRAAKAGPDYIDPAFHAAACGHASVNLDSWAMPPALLDRLLRDAAADADIVVIEAAMGLFDGAGDEAGRRGAAADLAKRYGIPVALVIDASGQGQTIGAVALGFVHYDPAVTIAGVIANRIASPRHDYMVRAGLKGAGLPLLGAVARGAVPPMSERHLGLVQAREHDDLAAVLEALADLAVRDIDVAALLAAAAVPAIPGNTTARALPPPAARIALAQDDAFSFMYPHILAEWHAAGATILPFSPLADEAPDESANLCWLPGGYPELHAGRLAAAGHFMAGLRRFADSRPVHGECGGFMLLGRGLEDAGGARHAMAGLLDHESSFARRRLTLGYRAATLLADCPIGRAGEALRGHEYHYATITPGQDAPLAVMHDAAWQALGAAGARRGHVSGTFFHAVAVCPT